MSSYELKILKILKKEGIKFEREKSFKDLRAGHFRYDFYIPNYKGKELIIEVDGEGHFKECFGGGRLQLNKQKEHDRRKNSYCLANNILLYRIPYWEIDNITSFSNILYQKFKVNSRFHNDYLNF